MLDRRAASRLPDRQYPTGRLGFNPRLDRRWHLLRGETVTSKQADLVLLSRVLTESGIDYALIGGLALQVHQAEPRTTLDIDMADARLRVISVADLVRA